MKLWILLEKLGIYIITWKIHTACCDLCLTQHVSVSQCVRELMANVIMKQKGWESAAVILNAQLITFLYQRLKRFIFAKKLKS